MQRLEAKVAVITGGNSGIGFATAERFIEEGATVVITGRRADAVAEAAAKLGPKATGLVADAADLDATQRALQQVKAEHGPIDVLFLNAGVAPFKPLEDQDEAGFDTLFDINVKGPYFTVQRALPLLADGASIIFNTSVVNVKGFAGASVYSATKAAFRSFARTLTSELAPRGIRVNAVAPGPIETPIYGKLGLPAEQVEEMGGGFAAMVPLGRFGESSEVAGAVAFLASSDASFITGAELPVDGGLAQV